MTEEVKTPAKKRTTKKKAPEAPTRITSANRKPLAPNLSKGHVVKV